MVLNIFRAAVIEGVGKREFVAASLPTQANKETGGSSMGMVDAKRGIRAAEMRKIRKGKVANISAP